MELGRGGGSASVLSGRYSACILAAASVSGQISGTNFKAPSSFAAAAERRFVCYHRSTPDNFPASPEGDAVYQGRHPAVTLFLLLLSKVVN